MKKMNMVSKFNAIKALLNGEKVEGFTLADAIEFIDGRIEQTEKKNASGANGERKPTKVQQENEGIKEQMVSVLRAIGKPATITDMQKSSVELSALSNQKISALLTQLVKSNEVIRTEVKGKAHFAPANAVEE